MTLWHQRLFLEEKSMKTMYVIDAIFLVCYILFDRLSKNKMEKKLRYGIKLVLIGFMIAIGIFYTMQSYPPTYATINQEQIQFRKDEVIDISYIEELKYFENTDIEVVANGERWGNKDYYSGDANVRFFNEKKEEIDYAYKCKAYINKDRNNYILLKTKGANKKYVFNFDTEEETKEFYEKLNKKFTELNE